MKKVLYLTNIEVPYRVRFFNELAKSCDLTVLYERQRSATRNEAWAKSQATNYRVKYLHGIKIGGESAFSLGILKEILGGYDTVIVGCYNNPVQMLAILVMRLLRISYVLNLDGEIFLGECGWKNRLKSFFISGAEKYLVAGEKSAESVGKIVGEKEVIPYYFSSLSDAELEAHRLSVQNIGRDSTILVIGQYFDYKGMDIALEVARMDSSSRYKFVGMGSRTTLFSQEHEIPENVELIPFLAKEELEQEYRKCSMLVLPSRQECWGLVVNEAASFGMPIVSTWGSGAAVEFLADVYPQYLAKPGDANSLYECIRRCMDAENKLSYSNNLLKISENYSIDESVRVHLRVCNDRKER